MEMLVNNVDLVNALTSAATTATKTTTGCAGVEIPNVIFNVVHTIVVLIQVVVPILLIIWGMIDFAKAVVGGDDDKIKAGQKTFVKRLIAAVITFLVVTIVQLLLSLVSNVTGTTNSDANGVLKESTITKCIDNFMNGVN